MKQKRFKPAVRKPEILAAALELAAVKGYMFVTRNEIAEVVGVAGSTVQYHFGKMSTLRNELMIYAVKQRHARVVLQGLALYDKHALEADQELKDLAWESTGP